MKRGGKPWNTMGPAYRTAKLSRSVPRNKGLLDDGVVVGNPSLHDQLNEAERKLWLREDRSMRQE